MELVMIAAVAKNNVIGNKKELPWYLPEDLKRFKSLTLNHPVIMGRNTYESIIKRISKPLPKRINIVLTSDKSYKAAPEVLVCNSFEEALKKASHYDNTAYVIGGQKVYEQAMAHATLLEITHLERDFDGDVYFPKFDNSFVEEKRAAGNEGDLAYNFVRYRKQGTQAPGLFIAFEGIDGSGKTTQLKKLVEYLFAKSKYAHVVVTREPYKETSIRKILHEQDVIKQAERLAGLFIEDRKKHASELISPLTEKGFHVITDRYKLSTLAYQSAQGLPIDSLISLHNGLPVPQITFIIDLPASEADKRMNSEANRKKHKLEENTEFMEKVREQFKAAKSALAHEKIFVIDGNRDSELIWGEVKETFERELGHRFQ